MAKISNLFRWIYVHITGRTTNFKWVIEDKLAGSGVPTSLREIKWLDKEHGIRSIVTIKEKPLPSEWFKNSGIGEGKIDYFHLSIEDYGVPSLEELDNVVNYISRQIDNGKPVMVHCSGGKGRTGTILAAYLIKRYLTYLQSYMLAVLTLAVFAPLIGFHFLMTRLSESEDLLLLAKNKASRSFAYCRSATFH